MGDYVKGQGSKFYLGKDETTALTEADFITFMTNLGEIVSEFNMIDVDPELTATTQSKVPGIKLARTFTVSGNLRDNEKENSGYFALKLANEAQKKVKYGITRPDGTDGIGGYCYVNKVSISEGVNEAIYKYSADITTTGDDELFELAVEEPTIP